MQAKIRIVTTETGASALDCAVIEGGPEIFVLFPGLYTKSLMPLAPLIAEMYRRFLEKYTICVFDRVAEPPEHCTVRSMADDTIRAMESLGIRDACVMGVSMGGMLAQVLAAARPDLVRCLVIGSSTSHVTDRAGKILREWAALARAGKADELSRSFASLIYTASFYAKHEKAILNSFSGAGESDLKRFAVFAECLCGFRMPENEKAVCPVLAVGGGEDRIFDPEEIHGIARRNGGRSFIYEHYGHAVYDEAADYPERVWNFFEEHGGGNAGGR